MSAHRRRRTTVRPSGILLTTGAALGVACLLAAAVCVGFGLRPMVVTTGSMSPAIPAGSLAFAQDAPAADASVGDVVAVHRADGTRVMHRVVGAASFGDQVELTLQGDANSTPDGEIYVVDRVLAVRFDVPWLGHPVSWMSTPWGLIGLGAMACGLLLFAFRPSNGPSNGRGGGRRRAAVAAVPLAAVLVSTTTPSSSAAFTDDGVVTGGDLTTHTVLRPDSVSCTTNGDDATFAWPDKEPRYDYEIVLWRDTTTDVHVSTIQVTGTSLSRTYDNDADFGLGGGLIGSNQIHHFYVTVRSWLSGTTAPNRWQSASVRQSTQRVRVPITCTIILLCTVGDPSCVA